MLPESTLREQVIFLLQAAAASTQAVVERVVENVRHYHATVPSITAEEEIESSLSQHGLYRAHGKAHASIRVARSEVGDQLVETRTYLVVDGKAVTAGKDARVPFQLNGAFSRIADTFFRPDRVVCYRFSLLPAPAADGSLQLTFTSGVDLPQTCPNRGTNTSGLARLDPATMQIRHLERTLEVPPPGTEHSVSFISIDYAPVQFGSESLWLPTVLNAEYDRGKGRFLAHYSAYRRYTGSSRILPAEGETAEPQP